MKKYFFLMTFVLQIFIANKIFSQLRDGELKEILHNHYRPMFGPVVGLNAFKYGSLELGADYVHFPKFNAYRDKSEIFYFAYLSTELQFGKEFVLGPKIGGQIFYVNNTNKIQPIGLGFNLINYHSQKMTSNVIRPIIGISTILYTLNYGYNIELGKSKDVLALNKHLIQIQIRIAPLIYLGARIMEACCKSSARYIKTY